jgi:hypothetical protein
MKEKTDGVPLNSSIFCNYFNVVIHKRHFFCLLLTLKKAIFALQFKRIWISRNYLSNIVFMPLL